MVRYAFEIIASFSSNSLRDIVISKIEALDKPFKHDIKISDKKAIFRSNNITLTKAKAIRDWIKEQLTKVNKKKYYIQIWYAKIGYETKQVKKLGFDDVGDYKEITRDIDVPKMENSKEITIGELGVTKVN